MEHGIGRFHRASAVVLLMGAICTGVVYASDSDEAMSPAPIEESGWLGPSGVPFERRAEVLEPVRVSILETCAVARPPAGAELPDLTTVAEQFHDLFELWWYGDEWSFAEFREQQGMPSSRFTGMQNHQELFLESVSAVRESAIRLCDARIVPWMIEGKKFERELGDKPTSSGTLLGTILPALSELEVDHATLIDLVVPMRIDAQDERREKIRCETLLIVTIMWDENETQWEVVTVTFSSYPSELFVACPPF